jgi:hypothetical protein
VSKPLTLDGLTEQVDATLRCTCSEVIVKSRGGDEVIRAKVVIIKEDRVFAVCKSCNTEVELPLEKSRRESSDLGPELYLDK